MPFMIFKKHFYMPFSIYFSENFIKNVQTLVLLTKLQKKKQLSLLTFSNVLVFQRSYQNIFDKLKEILHNVQSLGVLTYLLLYLRQIKIMVTYLHFLVDTIFIFIIILLADICPNISRSLFTEKK